MILTLDVGNSQIFGGVFHNRELTLRFRKPSRPPASSDELGLFLRSVLRENGADPAAIERLILDAARGSIMEFAWMVDAETGERVGVNPEYVVMLRAIGSEAVPTAG